MSGKKLASLTSLFVSILLAAPGVGVAQLAPPATPADPASAGFTLNDIWNRLTSGAVGTVRTGAFLDPTAGPTTVSTKTTIDLMAAAPAADNANGATPGNVLAGAMFWGLRTGAGAWGLRSGTMENRGAVTISPGASAQAIPAGYHNGSGTVEGDADLVAGSIRAGVNVFGVTGSVLQATGDATGANVLTGKTFSNANLAGISGLMANRGAVAITPASFPQTIVPGYHNGSGTVAGDADLVSGSIKSGSAIFGVSGAYPVAGVQKTGEKDCVKYNGTDWDWDVDCVTNTPTGQDGKVQAGLPLPSPRFTDNGNGTITDNLTGLVWLKNADCFGSQTWVQAMTSANSLNSGECDLTDGSVQGDWRLPNTRELLSLVHEGLTHSSVPDTAGTGYAKPGDPFTIMPTQNYWSSSLHKAYSPAVAICVVFNPIPETLTTANRDAAVCRAWPVRGGQ